MASGRHVDCSIARVPPSDIPRSPGTASLKPSPLPGLFDQSGSLTAAASRQGQGLRPQDGGSIQTTPEEMKPPAPREHLRRDPEWRSVQVPSTHSDTMKNLFVEYPEYYEPIVNPDDDDRGEVEVAAFLGGPGPPPDMEDELDRGARAYFEREVIKNRNIAQTSPHEAKMRSLSFERDLAVQSRDAIQVSIYTINFDIIN